MSLHDGYARLTPFEIAFPDRAVAEELSAAIAREAEQRGVDDTAPEAVVTTPAVAGFVRTLRVPEAPPESTLPFSLFVFHCVHFVRAGCPVYLLDTRSARGLVARAPEADPAPPERAGYLQMPQHLVWSVGNPGEAPESLDGIFWVISREGMLHTMPVSGLRPGRAGFGAMALPAAPLSDAGIWLNAEVRGSGDDFSSALPGGELDELYSVEAAGEVLKLVARFFAYAAAQPGSIERRPPFVLAGEGPRPSALAYARVTLAT